MFIFINFIYKFIKNWG